MKNIIILVALSLGLNGAVRSNCFYKNNNGITANSAIIYIYREGNIVASAVDWTVKYLNSYGETVELCELPNNSKITILVDRPLSTLFWINKWNKTPVEVNIESGKIYYFRIEEDRSRYNQFNSTYKLFLVPNDIGEMQFKKVKKELLKTTLEY